MYLPTDTEIQSYDLRLNSRIPVNVNLNNEIVNGI